MEIQLNAEIHDPALLVFEVKRIFSKFSVSGSTFFSGSTS